MIVPIHSLMLACSLLAPQEATADQSALQTHIQILCSAELDGRVLGSEGAQKTLQYLEQTLTGFGFAATDQGDGARVFRQSFDMLSYSHAIKPKLILTKRNGEEQEAVFGRDFNVNTHGLMRGTEKLEIFRFADPGIPASVASPQRALFFDLGTNLRKRLLKDRGILEDGSWGLEVRGLERTKAGYDPGHPPQRFSLQPPKGERFEMVTLLGDLAKDLRWLGFTHVQLLADESVEEVTLSNLVVVLPGSDPALEGQSVLVQAFFDHVAAVHLEQGQHDRGTHSAGSIAAMLEVARSLVQGEAPARTVILLFSAGRDRGALGVGQYLRQPAAPLAGTVGAISVVRPGVVADKNLAPEGSVMLSNFNNTPLGAAAVQAGLDLISSTANKLTLVQAARIMAKQGLPAQVLGVASQSGAGASIMRQRLLPTDYPQLEKATQTLLGAVRILASAEYQRPASAKGQRRHNR